MVKWIVEDACTMNLGKRFDLIVADPPYNLGQKYARNRDNLSEKEYLEFTQAWISNAEKHLKEDGSMFVFINPRNMTTVEVVARSAGLEVRRHIVWFYTFGQYTEKNFSLDWTAILYIVRKGGKFNFYGDHIRTPSWRQHYRDKRCNPNGKVPGCVWAVEKDGRFAEQQEKMSDRDQFLRSLDDFVEGVWQQPRLPGNAGERIRGGPPNQLPLGVVERIVLSTTQKEDSVLDLFTGNGTVALACDRLDRECWAVDICRPYLDAAKKRVEK